LEFSWGKEGRSGTQRRDRKEAEGYLKVRGDEEYNDRGNYHFPSRRRWDGKGGKRKRVGGADLIVHRENHISPAIRCWMVRFRRKRNRKKGEKKGGS